MPIQVPVVQTGLEQSIQQAATKVGKNLRINMGPGAKSIESLAKPLGRLTGKADEFTKSMEAANARVLAFGASVGVIAAVSNGLKELVATTIQVEKSLANINSILKQSESQLNGFKDQIFDIARNTGQTFDTVAEAALELSRQGLKAEEVTKRLNDALILSRLSGLSAADSVAGLTAAVNSFSSAGLTTTDVLNKISAAAASAAVSDRDLIEGLKRSGAVAVASGVQFDELIGIISALQERTSRGGAVIGNSLKTIFTRIQDLDRLQSLQKLGVEVTDLEGKVLSSNKIIENLAPTFAKLDQATKVNLADNLVGKFQIAPFLALLEDYNLKVSRSGEVAATSFNATNEAYQRNEVLSQTLAASINTATVSLKELANALGEIGVTDTLKNIIGVFNSVVSSITNILDGDGIGSSFAKGLIKGISSIISGPGLALALVAIGKLLLDFAKFGAGALRTFFGLNKAAEAQKNLQGQIAASLLNDKGIRSAILSIEKQNISEGEKKKLQTAFFTKALNEQLAVMQRMQGIARTIAPGVMAGTASRRGGRAAGGFLPIGAESSDISRGVGGAPASAKPVVIPNFAFGGGKRGTMVANDSEYIVPNYANGGDAIFNQNMVSSMGLPANARKVRAASGYIPNFATVQDLLRRPENYIRADGSFKSPSSERVYETSTGEDREALDKYRNRNKGKRSYMANQGSKKSVLLVPQVMDFQMNAADHHFKKGSYASKVNGLIDFFEGGAAGISPKLKNYKGRKSDGVKRLLGLDSAIADNLAKGVNKVFSDFKSSIGYITDPNQVTKSNIKDIMEKGGPGAFGAIKGAVFEALIQAITGNVSQNADEGSLDVVFSKDKSGLLEIIFGVDGKNFKFGDFKNSLDSKTKYARQILDNVKGQVVVGRKPKIVNSKTAASGYIPNFAEGALEEAIGREKAAGLPVSQIRINQSGKLRNAQNPMGLAVTNTRDEPTGAIPNYAKGDTGQAIDGLTNKLFALQSVMFLFQSGVGEMAEESSGVSKVMLEVSQAATQAVMALTALQAFGGIGSIFGKLRGGLGKIGGKGAEMMARGSGRMAAGRTLMGAGASAGSAGILGKGALTTFRGGLLKAGGALLRFAGPVGIGVTALTALNAAYKFGADKFLGTGNSIETAGKLIESSSKRASEALNKLAVSQEVKDKFKSRASTQAGRITSKFMEDVNLEGFSDEEQLKKIQESVEQLLLKGGDTETLERRFKTLSQKRESGFGGVNFVPQKAIDDFIEENTKQREDLSKKLEKFKNRLSKKQVEDEIKFRELQARRLSGEKLSGEEVRTMGKIRGDFFEFAKTQNMNTTLALEAVNQRVTAETEKQVKINKINLEVAKKTLDNQLELKTSKFRLLTQDEKILERAKSLNTLTKVQIIDLEKVVALRKLEDSFNDQMIEGLREQAQELVGLNANNENFLAVQDLINKRSKDGIIDLKDREDIAKKINNILLSDNAIGKAELNLLLQTLNGEKEKLELLKKQTEEKFEQQRLNQQDKDYLDLLKATGSYMGKASVNNMGLEFSKREATTNIEIRDLQRKKEIADLAQNQGLARQIERQIILKRADLEADREEFKTQPEFLSRARGIQLPASASAMLGGVDKVTKANLGLIKSEDPLKDLIDLRNEILKANNNVLPQDEKLRSFIDSVNTLQKDVRINSQAVRDNTDANNRLPLTYEQLSGINMQRATALDPFSRSEAANTRRLATAQSNVFNRRDRSGGNVDLELRRLTMERGVFTRMSEAIPTALENSDQLNESLKDASLSFAHNIGNAMLDAIEKGESLGDILLGTAAEFLSTMSRAFMKSAVNDLLGSFGVSNFQGGGPIRGGSGTKDDVPAMLMGGEFVINKKAVRKYGVGFMSALNSGSLQGFRSGGQVRDREGMFTTPGMNGAGSIVGARNLLSFATQTPIAMRRDTITSSGAFLDPESGRLSMFGRRNSPQFQKVQSAKKQAFDLYASELAAREQARRQKEESRKQLMNSLVGAAASVVVGAGIKSMSAGFKAGFQGTDGSFGTKLGAGLRGSIFGGNPVGGETYGGLANLFTDRRFSSGPPKAVPVTSTPQVKPVTSTPQAKLFTPKSPSARPSGNSTPLEDLSKIGAGDTLLPQQGTFATGGLIPPAGGVDTVPAMLSGGEFVMNAAATRNIGAGNLQALNSGAGVGDNTDLVAKLDELIIATETSQSTGEINITINGSTGTEAETQTQNTTDQQKALSDKIKTAVKQVIADEKRLGGQLRR